MAINYASKFSSKVDERFSKKSLSEAFTNMDYDWVGVSTISVYSIPTATMNDYSLTGTSRYGTPEDLANEVQEMTLTKDRAFTFVVDRRSEDDTMGAMNAAKALRRQVDEVIVPEIDTYVFREMTEAAIANGKSAVAAINATNAYEKFLDAQESLDNDLVPEVGRKAAVSPAYFKNLKLDDSFLLASELGQKVKFNGQVGECDGVAIIKVPSSRLVTNTSFILAHPVATVMAKKLTDYVTHKNAPGINGTLVEGRVRYDAFVLDNKVDAIYVHAVGVIS
ncbi:MAG: hypothetical protein RBR68_14170 [Tenuifilaceae bacterium]|nr:hypothetical protein [Tenuifilaceae bacterium]